MLPARRHLGRQRVPIYHFFFFYRPCLPESRFTQNWKQESDARLQSCPYPRHSQKHIWRWRDWIVESLNEDKSYDRMILEMLAGDELDPGNADTVRATGFLARNWYLYNRNFWLDDIIEHTAKGFERMARVEEQVQQMTGMLSRLMAAMELQRLEMSEVKDKLSTD